MPVFNQKVFIERILCKILCQEEEFRGKVFVFKEFILQLKRESKTGAVAPLILR